MAQTQTKIMYDSEEDILTLRKKKDVEMSLDSGDFVLDLDNKGNVIGVEILNASKHLGIESMMLAQIRGASLRVHYKPQKVQLNLVLNFPGEERKVAIPLTVAVNFTTSEEEIAFA